jgi:hypothetical protein
MDNTTNCDLKGGTPVATRNVVPPCIIPPDLGSPNIVCPDIVPHSSVLMSGLQILSLLTVHLLIIVLHGVEGVKGQTPVYNSPANHARNRCFDNVAAILRPVDTASSKALVLSSQGSHHCKQRTLSF